MRARISGRILGVAVVTILTFGVVAVSLVPAHAQSINGLGQAGLQFSTCQFATLDDSACGASSHPGGGTRWELSNPSPEPALGFVPAPCRRAPEGE